MSARLRALALLCIAAFANAEAAEDAAAIADRYVAAIERKGYAFLSKHDLARRRDQVAALVTRYRREPLDEPPRNAVLDGVDRCLDRLYATPAGRVDYGNGFGRGGEEWVYLNDRDYFLTFQYHLWVWLTRRPLARADAERRDAQRAWMRKYVTDGPWREQNPQGNEKIRPQVLAELERSFNDPLDLLYEPMPEDAMAKLRSRFGDFSNGIDADRHYMEVAALVSRFPSRQDPAGRYGCTYEGELPFDDTVDLWANPPHLCFASNADFRGHHGTIEKSVVYDVARCTQMRTAGQRMDEWLASAGRGELTLDGATLAAVRGARIAEISVKTWFEADKLPSGRLYEVLRESGGDRIPVERLPRMNGPHRGDRTEGEFFAVVGSREGRLAVLNLYAFEFNQLMFWCRPRTP